MKLEFIIQSYNISFQSDFISEGNVEIVQVACAAAQRKAASSFTRSILAVWAEILTDFFFFKVSIYEELFFYLFSAKEMQF